MTTWLIKFRKKGWLKISWSVEILETQLLGFTKRRYRMFEPNIEWADSYFCFTQKSNIVRIGFAKVEYLEKWLFMTKNIILRP